VLRVLDHFEVDKAHLVGLSMGGRIAMRTALLHPARVATLTLVDTHEGFAASRRAAPGHSSTAGARRCSPARSQATSPIRSPARSSALTPRPSTSTSSGAASRPLHKASYIKSLEATVAQVDLGDISAITAPAHFIVGADDPLTPPAMHQRHGGQARRRAGERVAEGGPSQQHREPRRFQ